MLALSAAPALLILATWPAIASAAPSDATSGDLYFTTFQNQGTCSGANCTPNVFKVAYSYNGSNHFSLGSPVVIATTQGADGIQFTPDLQKLLVGGQSSGKVFEVDPTSGNVTSVNSGLSADYHLTVAPDGSVVYTAGLPGNAATVPINPLQNGTAHTITGDDTSITQIAFVPGVTSYAYYTSSSENGNGDFGVLDLSTYRTTRLFSNVPAAHGMVYDPYTGDLILSGANQVEQIQPGPGGTASVVSTYTQSGLTGGSQAHFDQATVDGAGHVFIASNGGQLLFMDYSGSGQVGAANNFTSLQFLHSNLDDIVNRLPEVPYAAALPLLAVPALLWLRRRRRFAGAAA